MSGEVFQQNLDHEKDSRPGGPFIIQMLFKEWLKCQIKNKCWML